MSRYRVVHVGVKLPSQALAAAPRALTPLALAATVLALGVVTGSLVLSALLGPVALSVLGAGSGHGGTG
ncbi:MAG TPA: hypothetical protein VE127_12565, partial [Solirubrobacteraceae bacterium]|nr:hypothetical protein [Solirubrobacteraceae bacterium]